MPGWRWLLVNLFNLIRRFGSTIAVVGLLAYCAHEAATVLVAFAGRTSNANLALRLAANLNVAIGLSVCVSGGSIALYINERRLHRRTIERLSARNAALELKIDPNRSSSRLTVQGLTQKEDL